MVQLSSTARSKKPARPRRRGVSPAPARLRTPRRHAASRQQQLIDTALRVFARHGFSGTTTRQLASAAGVTEALIFKHFADKNDLYAAILGQKASQADAEHWFAELAALRAKRDDAGLLRSVYAHIVDRHERDPYFFRLMIYSALEGHPLARQLQESQGTRLYTFLERFVAVRQREGRFRSGSPAVLVRAILSLPVYHVLVRRLFRPSWPAVDPYELINVGSECILAGLRATRSSRQS